jgi:signal peptidase I
LPYFRLPALEKIDRNEPFVFNWPVGDSVYLAPDRSYTAYQVKTNPVARRDVGDAKLITRPIDKKDHYIKRCIAIAGDSLEVRNSQVYINGVAAENPRKLLHTYLVTGLEKVSPSWLLDHDIAFDERLRGRPVFLNLAKEQFDAMGKMEGIVAQPMFFDQMVDTLKKWYPREQFPVSDLFHA